MIAGGIGAALTTPLDVVKTRAMLEAKVSLCLVYTEALQANAFTNNADGGWSNTSNRFRLVYPKTTRSNSFRRRREGLV